jgi:DNA-binding CsgD family transcriptional regulator
MDSTETEPNPVRSDQASIILRPDGRVDAFSAQAHIWVDLYCGERLQIGRRPPELISRWVREQRGLRLDPETPGPASMPLVLSRGEVKLVLRYAAIKGRGCLLLEERAHTSGRTLEAVSLTPREAEVLKWVAQGKTNLDIANILAIRPRTVSKHLERIFMKLGVENRTAAAKFVPNGIDE